MSGHEIPVTDSAKPRSRSISALATHPPVCTEGRYFGAHEDSTSSRLPVPAAGEPWNLQGCRPELRVVSSRRNSRPRSSGADWHSPGTMVLAEGFRLETVHRCFPTSGPSTSGGLLFGPVDRHAPDILHLHERRRTAGLVPRPDTAGPAVRLFPNDCIAVVEMLVSLVRSERGVCQLLQKLLLIASFLGIGLEYSWGGGFPTCALALACCVGLGCSSCPRSSTAVLRRDQMFPGSARYEADTNCVVLPFDAAGSEIHDGLDCHWRLLGHPPLGAYGIDIASLYGTRLHASLRVGCRRSAGSRIAARCAPAPARRGIMPGPSCLRPAARRLLPWARRVRAGALVA